MITIRYDARDRLYIVGFYEPETQHSQSSWVPIEDFTRVMEACRFVHWLNGGNAVEWRQPDAL